MTPLQTAQELVTVLEQLATLETRREQLIAALAGVRLEEIALVDHDGTPTMVVTGESKRTTFSELADKPKQPRTSEEILADPSMGSRTPEEQAKVEADAMDVYEANVDPATTAQKKMIFGILSKQFGIKGDDELKQAIVAIIAHQHHGIKLESISKELSKVWAGGVIDYLESGPSTKEVMEIIKQLKDVPF